MKRFLSLLIFLASTPIFAQTVSIVSYPKVVVTNIPFKVVVNSVTIPSTGVNYSLCVDVKNPNRIEYSVCTPYTNRLYGNYTFSVYTKENATYTITARLLKNVSGSIYVVDTDSVKIKSLSEEYIKEYIDKIKENITQMKNKINEISDRLNVTNKSILNLKVDIDNIDKEIDMINDNITSIKGNQSDLAMMLNDIENKYVKLKYEYDNISKYLYKNVSELNNKIEKVNETINKNIEQVNNNTTSIWKYIKSHESEWSKDRTGVSKWFVIHQIQLAITNLKVTLLSVINNLKSWVLHELHIRDQKINDLYEKYNELNKEVHILKSEINAISKRMNYTLENVKYTSLAEYMCKNKDSTEVIDNKTMKCEWYGNLCSCYYRINSTTVKHIDIEGNKKYEYIVQKIR